MHYGRLIGCILLCLLVGSLGSIFTQTSVDSWYAQLTKPTFNPPNWVFFPVWTTLYILMGITLYLLWEEVTSKYALHAIAFFLAQLFLNFLWSVLFFGLQSPFFAFIEIIFLWLAILLTMILSYRVDHRAAYLMIPYLLWVSFAAFLNYSIMVLNP